ncbi:LysE family translocator [Massilia sp. Root335]|uniref:LysE family translocator n=1 Tax=Massilia sp. Root335 TaxID=1736517 RepID=UPI0006F65AA8|nr:LysE family translocator [Massilia sp. Root335]KQV27073.1 lysine transporter LysE [Massilia sp. Root335]
MSIIASMAAFALATSISPGPVNVVALGSGARHGFAASLAHVTGATAGFCLLLVLAGLGLHEAVAAWPQVTAIVRWAGVAFLLYMAWKLAADTGELGAGQTPARPSLLQGAAMQWLSPKAWLAALAGMGTYASDGDAAAVRLFALIYFIVCWLSVAAWAWAGSRLQGCLRTPHRVRVFNRTMAGMLVMSVIYLAAS